MPSSAALPDRPWRCFVAVPIGPDVRAAVQDCARRLRDRAGDADWRWSDPEAWHVTLAFMGATEPSSVPGHGSALSEVAADHEAFELRAGGLGAFPSRGRARVLWYGVADPEGRLARLARAVRAAVGLPPEDRFRGHLTLARARVRFGTDARGLMDVPAPDARLAVERLILFRSHLGRGSARYETLATATLPGAAP
ncbi:MAG TPA: RNA 2',3'-cyclic phosphodiesterase [Candidatus Limnocylindria bacterium]